MFTKEKIPSEVKEKYQLKGLLSSWLFDQETNAGFLRVGPYGVGTPLSGGAQYLEYGLIWKGHHTKIITKEQCKPSDSSPMTNRLYVVSHELKPIEVSISLESCSGDIIELVRQAFMDFGFAGSKEKSESVSVQFNRDRPIFFT